MKVAHYRRCPLPGRVYTCDVKGSRQWLCIVAALCLSFAVPVLLRAQDARSAPYTEYQVKAAYLSNLGRFVESWGTRPKPGPDASFDICVLGQDPFGANLDTAVKGEAIAGSAMTAKRVARVQEAQSCRVLFISAQEPQLPSVIAALAGSPVLTVSDAPDFVRSGGMIQFILDGSNVKFEINTAASDHAGLKLSSELLKLARSIRKAPK